ncbi:pyridoxamine 5'-phosphate oxidase family protein, partial [bacterium]|nr:pyridoxamine 5'-phosphate oxidase family protein [bacterium]
VNSNRILFPDYSGNKMFNTLGNITVNPNAGLLFLDFEKGNTLQLTGKAQVIWEEERIAEFAGAERLVEYEIEQVIEITAATNLSWRFLSYSPSNPTNML